MPARVENKAENGYQIITYQGASEEVWDVARNLPYGSSNEYGGRA